MRLTFDLGEIDAEALVTLPAERQPVCHPKAPERPLLEAYGACVYRELDRRAAGSREPAATSVELPLEAATEEALGRFAATLLAASQAMLAQGLHLASAFAYTVAQSALAEIDRRKPLKLDA